MPSSNNSIKPNTRVKNVKAQNKRKINSKIDPMKSKQEIIASYSLISEEENDEDEVTTKSQHEKLIHNPFILNSKNTSTACVSLLSEDEDDEVATKSQNKKLILKTLILNSENKPIACVSLVSEDEDEEVATKSQNEKLIHKPFILNSENKPIACASLLSENEILINEATTSKSDDKSDKSKISGTDVDLNKIQSEMKSTSTNSKNDMYQNIESQKLLNLEEPDELPIESYCNDKIVDEDDDDEPKLVIVENDEIETEYQMHADLVAICEEPNSSNEHIQAQCQSSQIYPHIKNHSNQNRLYIDNIDNKTKSPTINNREIVKSAAKCSINKASNNDKPRQFDYEVENAKVQYKKQKTMVLPELQCSDANVSQNPLLFLAEICSNQTKLKVESTQ